MKSISTINIAIMEIMKIFFIKARNPIIEQWKVGVSLCFVVNWVRFQANSKGRSTVHSTEAIICVLQIVRKEWGTREKKSKHW